jgi:uncharacterized protein
MSRSKGKRKIWRCPTCARIVAMGEPAFPFCSDHCKSIDLGKWASGAYRISSPILDPEVLEGLGELKKHPPEEDD